MNFADNLFIPVAHAEVTFGNVAANITSALEVVVPILFLAATIVFLAGVIMYISAGGKEDKIQKGRQYIIWGLIGLFVMVAVWGIVKIIINLVFGTSFVPSAPDLPSIPGMSGQMQGGGNIFGDKNGSSGGIFPGGGNVANPNTGSGVGEPSIGYCTAGDGICDPNCGDPDCPSTQGFPNAPHDSGSGVQNITPGH